MTPRTSKSWSAGPKELLFKYLHYIPWIVLCCALFLLMGYLKIRYSAQIYRVQAALLIKNDQPSSDSKDQTLEKLFMSGENTNLSNEIVILKSRPVLQRVANDLNLQRRYSTKGSVKSSMLYPNRPFQLEVLQVADSTKGFGFTITFLDNARFLLNEEKAPRQVGSTVNMSGNIFQILVAPDQSPSSLKNINFEAGWQPLGDVADGLINSINITQPNEESTILTLSFEGENRTLGTDVLNTIMAVYDTLMVEDKARISNNTLRFINARIYELSDTLRGVQGGIKDYMVKNQVFDVETQSKAYLDKIAESSKDLNQMEVRLSIVNYLLNYINDKKNMFELVPTNLGIEEPALIQLVSEYNRIQLERESNSKTTAPNNPLITGMDNALEKIRRQIFSALESVKQAYSIAVQNMSKQDEELQGNVTSLPGKSIQFLNISRREKILEDLYSLLLQKRLEISLSSASAISNSRVVEPALGSDVPVSPDKKKIYTLYLMLGLLIPVGIITLKEFLQDKIYSRADVEKYTDTPILGEIGHSEDTNTLVVTSNSRRMIAEQFRIARSNLQYIIGKKERPVIMVTSSFSGEGKSFVSTNIGAVMALSGKKTVVMEFDIRKPKIVSGLDLKRKMGITNYIIGKAEFKELPIKVEGVDGLYVIPCGPIPPNPAEILLDKRLDELMQEVFANFEVVIMDTAPIGLVSDSLSLRQYADCTIYIVRHAHTFRRQMTFIQELYDSKKLPSLCLLLNDVKAGSGYYGGYYGGGYGYGYYGGYGRSSGVGYFEDERSHKKHGILSRLFSGGRRSKG